MLYLQVMQAGLSLRQLQAQLVASQQQAAAHRKAGNTRDAALQDSTTTSLQHEVASAADSLLELRLQLVQQRASALACARAAWQLTSPTERATRARLAFKRVSVHPGRL